MEQKHSEKNSEIARTTLKGMLKSVVGKRADKGLKKSLCFCVAPNGPLSRPSGNILFS